MIGRLDVGENVTITVGPNSEGKSFSIPKAILTRTSEFFKACYASGSQWQEGITKTVTLPETAPDIFEVYLQWLMTGDLVMSDEYDLADASTWDEDQKHKVSTAYHKVLQQLAVFADAHGDACFGNVVVDWLIKTNESLELIPPFTTSGCLYDHFPEHAPIRRLLVDVHHGFASEEVFEAMKLSEGPRELMYDLMMSFRAVAEGKKEVPSPGWADRCHYHVQGAKVQLREWEGRLGYRTVVSTAQVVGLVQGAASASAPRWNRMSWIWHTHYLGF